MEEINICFTFDDNYAKYCATAMASILVNRKDNYKINFYLITDSIKEENKQKLLKFQEEYGDINIEFTSIKEEDINIVKNISTHSYLSIASFYRLLLPNALNSIDKILYLDCDILINADVKKLFANEMKNKIIGAVEDMDCEKNKKRLEIKDTNKKYFS